MSRASKLAKARGSAHSARHDTNVARDKLRRVTLERDSLRAENAKQAEQIAELSAAIINRAAALATARGAIQRLLDNPGPRKMDDEMTAHKKLGPHIEAVSDARKALVVINALQPDSGITLNANPANIPAGYVALAIKEAPKKYGDAKGGE